MNMEHLRCYSSAAEIGAEGELVTPFRQKTRFAPNYAMLGTNRKECDVSCGERGPAYSGATG
jgi:hypothetical protein